MAHLKIDTGSPTLRMTTSIHVISPVDTGIPTSSTLYLLHGAGDNSSTWQRLTTVEMYAARYGCTVIMPEVNRSYYTDMEYGLDYFSYITEELPDLCGRLLHLNSDPQNTYVAGLSMGGYGALKCALTYPERYAKVVSFSGVTDIRQRLADPAMPEGMVREMQAVFGTELAVKPGQDLYALSGQLVQAGCTLPPVLCCCGSEDPFVGMNREFAGYMENSPFDFRYVEGPGTHDWHFWEEHLHTAFDFLFEDKTEEFSV
ncbi:alpha/beta hydrolase family protein [Paenibacillus sp. JX-17]|uniref:Alpha/beta hydrolase family protein n=1 Tax=Paenibacillus lacisoli TaxID=3064525 RepID=A0ABT9CCD5_9BACL|nr:alpha/beta hydrolase family protein [Paenibacillus sp. JX-17]MDO7906921.1 alpha/beta hydrolase family protein [Paenibacillus sp. JX-17]